MKSRSIAGLSGPAAAVCAAGAGEPDAAVAAALSAAGVLWVAGFASVRVDADRGAVLAAATAGGVAAGASGNGARVSGAGAAAVKVGAALADVAAAAGAGLKGTGFSGSRGADGLSGVGFPEAEAAAVAGVFVVGLAEEEEADLAMERGALAAGFELPGTRVGAAADAFCAFGALAGRTERDASEDAGEGEDDRGLEPAAPAAKEVPPGMAAPAGAVLLPGAPSDAAGAASEVVALA
jgi:hypothetical protein